MTPLVIFGASGHARVIADAARRSGLFEVVGMLDGRIGPSTRVDGIEVCGDDSMLAQLVTRHPGLQGIVGVGDNVVREDIVKAAMARSVGFKFCAVIHPSAVVAADVKIGAGAFIAAAAVVNCGARIGAHAVVNTAASLDHDCVVEEFAFVAPQAALAGNVTVGRSAFVGVGACAIPGVTIGASALVGAGAAVTKDVAPGTTVGGVPARPLRRKA